MLDILKRTTWLTRIIVLVLVVMGCYFSGVVPAALNAFKNRPVTQPTTEVPSQAQPTVHPNTDPNVVPVQPGQPAQTADGLYPILCRPGTNLPQIDAAMDAYAGYYPLPYMIATIPASDKYCINWMPKWSGPGEDQYMYEEAQVEMAMRDTSEADGTGPVDVYFGTNGGLSVWGSQSGIVVYSPSQSTGADQIWALNNIASPLSTTGKPSFNDLLGRTIITSQGGADHFLTLRMMQLIGLTPNNAYIIFPESGTGNPVKNFCNGNGQAVAYWEPVISGANCQDATLLLSTKWWKGSITDYIVVSHSADANMQDALVYFLNDYNNATQGFTVGNLSATAQVLVNMQFEGNNMATWLMLNPADPTGSLTSLMDGVAIAKLSDNSIMFDKNISGSSLAKDQMSRAHGTWVYGGVNGNGNGDALFDVNAFVSDKYVKILMNNQAQNVNGDFSNTYDTDINQRPPAVDKQTLINLPDLYVMPNKQINFAEGYSSQLISKEEETKLLEMVSAAAVMLNESDDSVIVIRGGMGVYSADPDQRLKNADFALRRAQYIQKLLVDKLHIPIQRIILDRNVLLPDHALSAAELQNYMVVIISIKNANYK